MCFLGGFVFVVSIKHCNYINSVKRYTYMWNSWRAAGEKDVLVATESGGGGRVPMSWASTPETAAFAHTGK